jgi:fucose permease
VLPLFFVGSMIARMGARRATALAAVAMGAVLAMALQWPSLALLLPSMVMFGAAMSLYDVAINTEGSAIENLSGRAIMSGLHGMFSAGAMTGAALTAALIAVGIPPGRQLAGIGIGLAVIVAWASRSMLVTHPTDLTRGAQAHFACPRGTLLVIGLLIFAGMSAEGAMYDWCVRYLQQEVHLSQDQAGLGYPTCAGAMAIARFGGDALHAHYTERTLLRVGGTVAAAAMQWCHPLDIAAS